MDLMTPKELDWLDEYHATVWNKISPLLQDDTDRLGLQWLKDAYKPINRP